MSLFNQNWIGVNGEPVTGKVPPTLRVSYKLAPGALSPKSLLPVLPPQVLGQTYHAYKLFTDAIRVTPHEHGYHVQNRKLNYVIDGQPRSADLRMTSNNDVHIADLTVPLYNDEALATPSGIGLTLTTIDNMPIEKFSREKTEDPADEAEPNDRVPIPFIIRPEATLQGGIAVATGKYKITFPPKLVGGRALWAKPDGSMWFTIMAPEEQVMWPLRVRSAQTLYNREAWFTPEFPRAQWSSATDPYYSQPTTVVTGGALVAADNTTVAYLGQFWFNGVSPVFMATIYGQKSLAVVRRASNTQMQVHYIPLADKDGLETDDLTGAPRLVGESEEILFIGRPAGTVGNFAFRTAVHPSGQRFVTAIGTLASGQYMDVTLPAAVDGNVIKTLGVVPLAPQIVAPANTGVATSHYTRTRVELTVPDVVGPAFCDNTGTITYDRVISPSYVTVQDATRQNSRSSQFESLQTISFDRTGKLVTFTEYTQSADNVLATSEREFREMSADSSAPGYSETHTVSCTHHTESLTRYKLADRLLVVESTEGNYTSAHDFSRGDDPASGSVDYVGEGDYAYVKRTILLYDPDFDFAVYVERSYGIAATVATSWSSITVSATPLPNTGRTFAFTGSLKLIVERGATRVATIDLPTPTFTPIWNDESTAFPNAADVTGDLQYLFKNPTYQAAVQVGCTDGSVSHRWALEERTLEYYDELQDTTGVFSGWNPISISSPRMTSPPLAETYFHVETAKDPVTGARAAIVTFRRADFRTAWNAGTGATAYPDGPATQTWSWFVDQTGAKTLNEVLGIPSGTEIKVWDSAAFNSMVSI